MDISPCIGCGGCISSCPVQALSFQKQKDKVSSGGKEE
ncbi:MAG: 4Fe-4S dicluster domain-containing protein [Leptospiraceae bacterium]|nr:4Fe-4S dicluster domain-containing protein [Leptospiraceae bacterium]